LAGKNLLADFAINFAVPAVNFGNLGAEFRVA
jgi:hypothetical protein